MPPKKRGRQELCRLQEQCAYGYFSALQTREDLRRYFLYKEEVETRGAMLPDSVSDRRAMMDHEEQAMRALVQRAEQTAYDRITHIMPYARFT